MASTKFFFYTNQIHLYYNNGKLVFREHIKKFPIQNIDIYYFVNATFLNYKQITL